MAVLMEGQPERTGSLRLNTSLVLLGTVLALILLVRLSGLTDTTAFFDEALYALVGRKILLQVPDYAAIRWITGSYLYPLLSGQASLLFDNGLYGVRLISVISTTGAALAVYALTARLFNQIAALMALIVFGFTGVSMFVGQLGTYDGLGIACLAVALVGLVYGLTETDAERQMQYLALGGIAFALSILSKYVALFFLPVGGLLLVLLVLNRQGRLAVRLVQNFWLPAALLVGAYGLLFREDLLVLVGSVQQFTSQPASREVIVRDLARDLVFPFLLALIGSGCLLLQKRAARPADRAPEEPLGGKLLLLLLWSAAAVFPVYHVLTSNIRALDKHMAYALLFLAPLAGWGIYQVFQFIGQRVKPPLAQAVASICCIGVLLFAVGAELDRSWGLNHSWPDKQATLNYLASLPIKKGTRILAEGGDTYVFHLNWETTVDMASTWSFFYGGRSGLEAMKMGIADHYFQYLILDRYFTPEVSAELQRAALAAGYRSVFQHSDPLSSGEQVITNIYALPDAAALGGVGSGGP